MPHNSVLSSDNITLVSNNPGAHRSNIDMMPTIPLIPVNVRSTVGNTGVMNKLCNQSISSGMLSKALRGGLPGLSSSTVNKSGGNSTGNAKNLLALSRSNSLTNKQRRGASSGMKVKRPFGM